ncbi:unnamed protein product, partial [marine sediment metagenome]
ANDTPAMQAVLECYKTARDVFEGFVKDFIREHLYPHIRNHVPSSTKEGRDALYKRLKMNKELYRIEEKDYGDIESLLADFIGGKTNLGDVLRTSKQRTSIQRQRVSSNQVSSVEEQNLNLNERLIDISITNNTLIVTDDGIGMDENVLRNNFWKAGSSGKKTELAQRSGVIGTFGIGAMANFGVCSSLKVETRNINSDKTLISIANRDELKISEDCIELNKVSDSREPGTKITAILDETYQ